MPWAIPEGLATDTHTLPGPCKEDPVAWFRGVEQRKGRSQRCRWPCAREPACAMRFEGRAVAHPPQ